MKLSLIRYGFLTLAIVTTVIGAAQQASAAPTTQATTVRASTTAEAVPTAAINVQRYCDVLLNKERDSEGYSKILATSCSDVSMTAATSQAVKMANEDQLRKATVLGLSAKTVQPLTTASGTLLANEYRDLNYGTAIYAMTGAYGTCDTAGYSVRNSYGVRIATSSIYGYGLCNVGNWTNSSGNGSHEKTIGCVGSNGGYVGDSFNDDVYTLHIYYDSFFVHC